MGDRALFLLPGETVAKGVSHKSVANSVGIIYRGEAIVNSMTQQERSSMFSAIVRRVTRQFLARVLHPSTTPTQQASVWNDLARRVVDRIEPEFEDVRTFEQGRERFAEIYETAYDALIQLTALSDNDRLHGIGSARGEWLRLTPNARLTPGSDEAERAHQARQEAGRGADAPSQAQ